MFQSGELSTNRLEGGMKKVLGMLCAAALVCGCAVRPQEGPGSGSGAGYVPMVEPTQADASVYDADVAKCQKSAATLPLVATQHDDALAGVDAITIGTGMSYAWPGLLGVVAVGGLVAFDYVVYTPERTAWKARQETLIANCMAQKGYVNTDPTVRVTWVPLSKRPPEALRRTGVDTYNAEQYAKAQRCNAMPMAQLVDKGPGYERHSVACSNGQLLAVRCEFGNCRATQGLTSRQ
jgi:hypothetical protein